MPISFTVTYEPNRNTYAQPNRMIHGGGYPRSIMDQFSSMSIDPFSLQDSQRIISNERNAVIEAVVNKLGQWQPIKKYKDDGGILTYEFEHLSSAIIFNLPFIFKNDGITQQDAEMFFALINSVLQSNMWPLHTYKMASLTNKIPSDFCANSGSYSYPILGLPHHPIAIFLKVQKKLIDEFDSLRLAMNGYLNSALLLSHKEMLNDSIRQYNDLMDSKGRFEKPLEKSSEELKVVMKKTIKLYTDIESKLALQDGEQLVNVSHLPNDAMLHVFSFFNKNDAKKSLRVVSKEWNALAEETFVSISKVESFSK